MSATITPRDQNGNLMRRNVRKEEDGSWGVNVWFGADPATNVRRYYYTSRAAARAADISDVPGQRGCIRYGTYLGES